MEVVDASYTRGFRKKMVERKMKKSAGSSAGEYYLYGVNKAADIESYHSGFKLIAEWSCFEDDDLKPAILRWFRHFRFFSRNQYTLIADITSADQY